MADIPGLIEGASQGVGLGYAFLKHIERTKVLVHVVDAASTEGRDPVADIRAINEELRAYNPELLTLLRLSRPIKQTRFTLIRKTERKILWIAGRQNLSRREFRYSRFPQSADRV